MVNMHYIIICFSISCGAVLGLSPTDMFFFVLDSVFGGMLAAVFQAAQGTQPIKAPGITVAFGNANPRSCPPV